MSQIIIGIVTHNRKEKFLQLLALLSQQISHTKNCMIYAVENGSHELTESDLAGFPIKLFFVTHASIPVARNFIFAKVRNSAEKLVFIDDDCVPGKDWFNELKATHFSKDVVAIQGKAISIPKNNLYAQTTQILYDEWIHSNSKDDETLTVLDTKNLVIDLKKLHKKKKLFNTTFAYASDAILAADFIKSGFKCVYNQKLLVYHQERTTVVEFIKHRMRLSLAYKKVQLNRETLRSSAVFKKFKVVYTKLNFPTLYKVFILSVLICTNLITSLNIVFQKLFGFTHKVR